MEILPGSIALLLGKSGVTSVNSCTVGWALIGVITGLGWTASAMLEPSLLCKH